MHPINQLYGHVFYLTVERRKLARSKFLAQCNCLGLTVERFEGIDIHKNGLPLKIAVNKSVIKMLEIAIEKDYESILILEDDAKFLEGMTEEVESGLNCVPEDWDILHLNVDCNKPKHYNEFFTKITCGYRGHAIGIHKRFFKKYIDYIERSKGCHCCSALNFAGDPNYSVKRYAFKKRIVAQDYEIPSDN